MKRKTIYIGIFLLATIFTAGILLAKMRSKKAQPQTYYSINDIPHDSATIRIGMIGDSWASIALQYGFNDYLDSLLHEQDIPSETLIKGIPGAKTKAIYLNLFSEKASESFKYIIQHRPQYCIVSAGINDLHGQYGEEYYKHNLLLIIKALLHYDIKPIILEIPYFYNLEQYKVYGFPRRSAYRMLSLIHSCNFRMDNLLHYRKSLVEALKKEQLEDRIIYISTDSILQNKKDLYTDNMHINKEGYHLLGVAIVQQITNDIDKKLP